VRNFEHFKMQHCDKNGYNNHTTTCATNHDRAMVFVLVSSFILCFWLLTKLSFLVHVKLFYRIVSYIVLGPQSPVSELS